jgi:hypothetical protein
MPWAVSRWSLISKAPLRFHKISCGFGVEPSDNVAGFSPSISVFACTYHFTDAPSACCSYQKYKWAVCEYSKQQCSFRTCGALGRKYSHILVFYYNQDKRTKLGSCCCRYRRALEGTLFSCCILVV